MDRRTIVGLGRYSPSLDFLVTSAGLPAGPHERQCDRPTRRLRRGLLRLQVGALPSEMLIEGFDDDFLEFSGGDPGNRSNLCRLRLVHAGKAAKHNSDNGCPP